MSFSRASSRRSAGSVQTARGTSSRLFCGRYDSSVAHRLQALGLVVGRQMRDPALLAVGPCPAQFLDGGLLAQHRPGGLRAGQEQLARALHHEGEVGQRRRIRRGAAALPHDGRDLRHHAGGHDVAEEDVGVGARARPGRRRARQRSPASWMPMIGAPFFMARSTTLTVFCAKRSREIPVGPVPVLREQVDVAPVDLAVPGDHAVDEHVQLHEGARVEHRQHALARAQKIVLTPSRRLLGPPFEKGLLLQQAQPLQSLLAGHDREILMAGGHYHASPDLGPHWWVPCYTETRAEETGVYYRGI